jgi:hypothetical protein
MAIAHDFCLHSAEVMSPLTAPLIAWFVPGHSCGPGFVVVARGRHR